MTSDDFEIVCHRCGKLLERGVGAFYLVKIEAVSDPSPPNADALLDDDGQKLDELLDQLDGLSEREMMDQVQRTLTMHLCNACYRGWIEHPVG